MAAWQVAAHLPRFALITVLAVSTNVIASMAGYFLAVSLGVELNVWDSVALVPVALFAMMIPISIAGWGVREGVLVFLLGSIGIPAEHGFLFSIAYGIAMVVTALRGG